VPAALFAFAPRHHSGTIVGLRQDEQAAILQNGEEVLAANDPRNALNGGAVAPAEGAGQSIKQVLVFDPSEITGAMATSSGEKAILTVLQRNRATVRQMLG